MKPNILLLVASQTGNAEDVADEVHASLTQQGLPVVQHDLSLNNDINILTSASCVLGVVSTWGDGEPPDDAVDFFDNLRDAESLGLEQTPISVLGLGDKGYDRFCQCGIELERHLLRHGGKVLIPRVDCDTWYEEEVESWKKALLAELPNLLPAPVHGA